MSGTYQSSGPSWPPKAPTTAPVPLRYARELLNPVRPASLDGLSTALTVLLSVAGVIALGRVLDAIRIARTWDGIAGGDFMTPANFTVLETLSDLLWLGTVVTTLAIAPLLLTWMWRLAKNAGVLSKGRTPSTGWAVGGWFIPVAGFIIPAVILLRVDKASDASRSAAGYRWAIPAWAAAFAAFPALSFFADTWATTVSPATLATSARVDAVGYVALALSAGLAVLVVRSVSARQHLAFAVRAEDALAYRDKAASLTT